VEKYLWQGLTRLLAVYNGSNALLMRFEYADERTPVAMTSGGLRYYLGYDQVGSLIAVADGSGSVVKRIIYDSFGNVLEDSNPGFSVPFGFAGGLHDRDTGLVRFGYRDYDPEVGRWTAKDPIGFAGGDTDLYGYVLNDPVNIVDPTGEAAFWYHFVDGYRAGMAMGKGLRDSLSLGWATMMPDLNELKYLPEAHATTSNPRNSPQEAINNSLNMATDKWNLGTIEGQGIAIHIWRDVVSHKGSYFPVTAGIRDYFRHIVKYDLLSGGSFADVIASKLNIGNTACE
jgi:RHS repeat-associated protein